MKKHRIVFIGLVTVSVMTTLFTLALTPPPQTVVFDIKGTLERYQETLLEAGLSDDEHHKRLGAFDKKVRQILDDYANTHHLVIVVPGAVITGAPDMTIELQHHIIDEMKRHQQEDNALTPTIGR